MLSVTIRSALAGAGLLAALGATGAVGQTPDITGVWLTGSGDSRVKISPCGGAWCGTIVWTRSGARDVHNPDPAKRDRSLAGVQMISGMKRNNDGNYSGQLYNPMDGKTYTGKLQPASASELQLKGCVMGGLICKSQTWKRVQ
ncbi:DUF2147 domain-containing protein [Camelimonas sp. ID_303_24]